MPRLTLEQLKKMDRRTLPAPLLKVLEQSEKAEPSKPRKYRNRLFEDAEHILFESEWEAQVRDLLEMDRQAGLIARWSYGPRFVLQRDPLRPRTMITYRPDFIVWPPEDHLKPWYVIDAKGVRTQPFMLRVRMWKVRFPDHPLILWTAKGGRLPA